MAAAAAGYAAPSPYQPAPAYAAAPTYAPQAMPAYGMATSPTYAAVTGQTYTAPAYATPAYTTAAAAPYGGYPGAAVTAYAAPAAYAPPQQAAYTLDSGDRLRVVVFGQDGLTNSYVVDASGHIAMPLIGSVAARGLTTDQLSARIAGMLRQGYMREPHVAVEVEAYRPFFILGEVTQPGQYPYVANMTVETAVAIAGGFDAAGLQARGHHQPQLRQPSLSLQDADHRADTAGRHHPGGRALVLTPLTDR